MAEPLSGTSSLPPEDDLHRLRAEYADRARRLAASKRYSLFNPTYLFETQQRQRATLKLLRRQGWASLADKRVLEVGCGRGQILHDYLGYGVGPGHLHAVDLLLDRVAQARSRLPHLALACADGQRLPYPAHSFDLVLQYTAMTSVLDDGLRKRVAADMLRVLRPDGMIVWYDFWLNPTNAQTRGIRPTEIKQLFPGCRYDFRRVTLAPPLARRLLPLSWLLCSALESLRIVNTHYLVAIRPLEG